MLGRMEKRQVDGSSVQEKERERRECRGGQGQSMQGPTGYLVSTREKVTVVAVWRMDSSMNKGGL